MLSAIVPSRPAPLIMAVAKLPSLIHHIDPILSHTVEVTYIAEQTIEFTGFWTNGIAAEPRNLTKPESGARGAPKCGAADAWARSLRATVVLGPAVPNVHDHAAALRPLQDGLDLRPICVVEREAEHPRVVRRVVAQPQAGTCRRVGEGGGDQRYIVRGMRMQRTAAVVRAPSATYR